MDVWDLLGAAWVPAAILLIEVLPGLVLYTALKSKGKDAIEAIAVSIVLSQALVTIVHAAGGASGLPLTAVTLLFFSAILISSAVLVAHTSFELPKPGRDAALVLVIAALMTSLAAYPAAVNQQVRFRQDNDFHAGVIHSILQGKIPPESPVIAGLPLGYYWLYPLHNSVLANTAGIHPTTAIYITNAFGLLALILLVYLLTRSVAGGPGASIFSMIILIFGLNPLGGLSVVRGLVTEEMVASDISGVLATLGLLTPTWEHHPGIASILVGFLTSHPIPLALPAVASGMYFMGEYAKRGETRYLAFLAVSAAVTLGYHLLIGAHYIAASCAYLTYMYFVADKGRATRGLLVLILSCAALAPYFLSVGVNYSDDTAGFFDLSGIGTRALLAATIFATFLPLVFGLILVGLLRNRGGITPLPAIYATSFLASFILFASPGEDWKYPHLWMIPLSVLSAAGFMALWKAASSKKSRAAVVLAFALILPSTNLVVAYAYATLPPGIIGDADRRIIYDFIRDNTQEDAVFVFDDRIHPHFLAFTGRASFLSNKDNYIRSLKYDRVEVQRRLKMKTALHGASAGTDQTTEAFCQTTGRPTYYLNSRPVGPALRHVLVDMGCASDKPDNPNHQGDGARGIAPPD